MVPKGSTTPCLRAAPMQHLPCPISAQTAGENDRPHPGPIMQTHAAGERALLPMRTLCGVQGLPWRVNSLASKHRKSLITDHQIHLFSKITILFDFLPVPLKQIISISEGEDLHLVIEIFG